LLLFPRDEGYGAGGDINIRFLQDLYPFSAECKATVCRTDAQPTAARSSTGTCADKDG